MKKEMKKVPAVRFKGFTGDWEQRKLGEIADKVTSKNKEHRYKETLTNSAEQGIVSQKEYFDHSISNIENINGYYVVEDNDFVYNPRISTSAPVGPINRNKLGRTGVMSPLYTVFKPHEIDESYLEWFFKSSHWYKFMYLNGDTGARSDRFAIKDSVFFKMPISVPTFEEQYKVGDFLNEADHLLTLNQQKLDQLKKLKAYFLQNLFPAKGEKVPKIRFKGFTGEWEEKKFSEFIKNVAVRNKNDLPLEVYAVTNDKGFVAQKDAHADFGYMNNVDRTVYNIVPPNSFAYNPARINVGSIGYYSGTKNVIVSSLYEVFQTADFIDDQFLWQWIKSNNFPRWVEKLQEGSVRLYFYYDKLQQVKIMLPSLEEQKIIGTYLERLDAVITFNQQKITHLQAVKKFLLQNLFV